MGCDYLSSRNLKLSFDQKKCTNARDSLLNELKDNHKDAIANYNLSFYFICNEELPLAIEHIGSIIANGTPFEFELYFLKAFLLGKAGRIDEALLNYQYALEFKPANRDVKKNMELLLSGSKNGKGGKKSKGKGKQDKDSQADNNSKGANEDPERDSKQKNDEQNNRDPKESKSKKMSQKQIEKIMKEINGDEKKIRSQGLKIKTKEGTGNNEKNW